MEAKEKIRLCSELKQIIVNNDYLENDLLLAHVSSCKECKSLIKKTFESLTKKYPIIKHLIPSDILDKIL